MPCAYGSRSSHYFQFSDLYLIHMGNLLNQPSRQINHQVFVTSTQTIHASAIQGWRPYMEDFTCVQKLSPAITLVGVFDGHGGPEVAAYASTILGKQLLNQPFYRMGNYARALTSVFKRVDEMIDSKRGQQQMKRLSEELSTSTKARNAGIKYETGTTANVVLLTADKYYIANIGDSRSVLCRNGNAITLSTDHKPLHPVQKARIVKAGGSVENNRINGTLNLSRAFGDYSLKSIPDLPAHEQLVISIPEIRQVQRNGEEDEFIIIASDGVWQRYGANSQILVDKVREIAEKQGDWKLTLEQVLTELLAGSVHDKAGHDNMTMLLVVFNKK